MIVRKLLPGLLALLLIFSCGVVATRAYACAGYTIVVGSDGSQRQELITQVMAELIRQRTGTKIQIVRFSSQAELVAAAERHDVDLLVVSSTPKESFQSERLRTLKPFGYQNEQVMPAFQVATLKRFPALQRLVDRLAGKIDDATLRRLETRLNAGSDLRAVAKKFLSDQQLIFGN